MKREEGYYWVKVDDKWVVAEYYDCAWFHTGTEMVYGEPSIINETRILSPDEQNYGAKFNIDGVTYVSQRKP